MQRNFWRKGHEPLPNLLYRPNRGGSDWGSDWNPNRGLADGGEEEGMKTELAREIGRFIFFLLLVSGWTFFMLALVVEK